MSALRKKFIGILAVLFCAMLALSTVLFLPGKSANAGTRDANSSAFSEIGSRTNELYTGSATQKSFNSTLLKELYSALTGVDNATYKDVEDMVYSGPNNSATNITASQIYKNNGYKNVSVWFAEERWDATFMTTVRTGGKNSNNENIAGDIVLDLWLSADRATDLAPFGARTATNNSSDGGARQPSGMYGKSKIRVDTLNAGGVYSTDSNDDINGIISKGQDPNNEWARFTMSQSELNNGKISVKEFLVQPQYIEYQEKEKTPGHSSATYQCPNDAYDTNPSGYNWSPSYNNVNYHMSEICQKTGYSDWKEDYVWLPSLAETGDLGNATDPRNVVSTAGIWQTTGALRWADTANNMFWLRSCVFYFAHQSVLLATDDNPGGLPNIWVYEPLAVRPAIHLNLTKAEAARGIDFGTDDTDSDTDNGVKVEELKKTYTGEEFTLDIPDYDRLTFSIVTNGNVTSTEVNNIQNNGKFKATKPATDKAKTYAITVTPKSGQYWDDTANAANPNDRTVPRQYRITIELAEMSVDWGELNVAYGASLLGQSTSNITSPDLAAGTSFATNSIEYIVVTPDDTFDSGSPPSKEDTNWKSTNVPNSTATAMGTYHVWYKITADYHEVEIGYYDVTVGQDALTVTVTDDTELSGKYGQKDGNFNPYYLDSDWLKNQFADKVTITTGSNTYDDPDEVLDFLDEQELEVVLLKSDGQEAPLNTHDRYDAGDYYIGLKDASGSYSIKWTDNKKPAVKIAKKEAKVKIVAKDAGVELKSTYGDAIVNLEYEIVSGVFDNEALADLKMRYDSFKIEDGTALSETTPAGTHQITGAARGSNYDVSYDRSDYKVEPRPITLKITDKEVEYGTDLTDYKFEMTITSGNLVGGDDFDVLTADAVFTITYNGTDADKSNLYFGTYEISGTVPEGNYIFTVDGGKLTVTKKNFDMSGVTLVSTNKLYDGTPKLLQISGDLPSTEISVSYRYVNTADGSESTEPPVEVGLYLVYASFTHNDSNYNAIDDKVAYLRIVASADELNQSFPPLPSDEDIAAAADLAKKKDEAKKTLDEEAKKKKDEIDADVNLTPEEKKAAKDEIDEELKKGNEAIDKAKDKDGVNKAYDDGKKEMEDTAELVEKKGAAKSELDKAAQAKKDAIDNNPELTDEEKQAAKDKVDEELAKGKAEINSATDVNGVQSVESSTKTNIENIKPEHSGSFPWWILAVIAGAIVLLTVLIIVIVKRRNAEDDDGYDDFYDDEYDYEEEEESDDDEAYGY